MRTAAQSSPGDRAKTNEDHFLVADDWALVLDGITRYPDDGCVHDVPWYVTRLGAAIADRIGEATLELTSVLAQAVDAVNRRHADTCDLRNPVSPGATVGMVRLRGDAVEWLVLGDCAIAWRDRRGECRAESDTRLARLADPPRAADVGGIRRYPVAYIAQVRNREGGFWVAATDPSAAERASTGTVRRDRVADMLLCTDGLTRLVERYGYSWPDVFDEAASGGVPRLIDLVRAHAEADTAIGPRSKRHDDATGVLLEP